MALNRRQLRSGRSGGFTLLEALLMLTILSVIAVAAGVGLQSGARIPEASDNMLAIDRQLSSALEEARYTAINSWASLASATTTVTINGTSYSQVLTVTAQNAPDGSGATTDWVQVTVTINGRSMTTFFSQP
jgi:type II secretory pathway pseudopilin PulG